MAKKDNSRERLALTVLAIQQAIKTMEQEIRWIKRELRKRPVRMFRDEEAP